MNTQNAPLSEMNTTPLIDVLLVLLIMFIISVPIATDAIEIDLPSCTDCPVPDLEPDRNKIVVTADDRLLWNGRAVDPADLASALQLTTAMPVEPELQFEPDASASYDTTAKTLALIESSGVTKFGFVGNERYREF